MLHRTSARPKLLEVGCRCCFLPVFTPPLGIALTADLVLGDVVLALLKPSLLDTLFEPQLVYTPKQLLTMFQDLAHASIMKLSDNSMSKLFDLMSMGFKYHVIAASIPPEILQITRNHLDELRNIVAAASNAAEVITAIDAADARIGSIYDSLTYGDWMLVQQTILAFFQDRRVKVSLFLNSSIQRPNGTFIVDTLQGVTPPFFNVPGAIIYAPSGTTGAFETLATLEPCTIPAQDRASPYGFNMYAEATAAATESGPGESNRKRRSRKRRGLSKSIFDRNLRSKSAAKALPKAKLRKNEAAKHAALARAELAMLSSMLGVEQVVDEPASATPFLVNLFPDLGAADSPARKPAVPGAPARAVATGSLLGGDDSDTSDDDGPATSGMIVIDAQDAMGATHYAANTELSSIMTALSNNPGSSPEHQADGLGDEDDLLALMDGA